MLSEKGEMSVKWKRGARSGERRNFFQDKSSQTFGRSRRGGISDYKSLFHDPQDQR